MNNRKTGMFLCRSLLVLLCAAVVPLFAEIIKTKDAIQILVVEHPEFSGRYVVTENGTIDYPLLADAQIVNTTTAELMNDITLRLARHFDNPLVLVSIVKKPDMTVTVLGQVMKPGPVVIYQGASVQEIVQAAGGALIETADLEHVKIIHATRTPLREECNLRQFLIKGDVEQLPTIVENDMIVVPQVEKTRKVKVIGAVQKPGLYPLESETNLFEIVYLAGGPAEKSDLSRVRRLSQSNKKTVEEVIDLQMYIDKGRLDDIPLVAEGDIIIVYTKWFDAKTFLTVLNNTLLVIVTIQAFAGVFK